MEDFWSGVVVVDCLARGLERGCVGADGVGRSCDVVEVEVEEGFVVDDDDVVFSVIDFVDFVDFVDLMEEEIEALVDGLRSEDL